jgi:hypothetical protein
MRGVAESYPPHCRLPGRDPARDCLPDHPAGGSSGTAALSSFADQEVHPRFKPQVMSPFSTNDPNKEHNMRIFDFFFRRPTNRLDRTTRRDVYAGFTRRDWADLPVHHPVHDER